MKNTTAKRNGRKWRKFEDLPLCMGVKDVATAMGISDPVAYELAHREDFPSIRVGCNGKQRKIVIPRDRFLKWLYKEDYEAITGDVGDENIHSVRSGARI